MTTLEQIEMVEAWAWLHAGGGLPGWDDTEEVGVRGHQRMELLFFKFLRFRYTHVQRQWYTYALWAAERYAGRVDRDLVEYVKNEVAKKFTRTPTSENPLQPGKVDEVLRNLPPFEPPFDEARLLTKTIHAIMRDDWTLAAQWKSEGMSLGPAYLREFRPDISRSTITNRIAQAKENNDD
jgi:hypothetical protein